MKRAEKRKKNTEKPLEIAMSLSTSAEIQCRIDTKCYKVSGTFSYLCSDFLKIT